MVLMTLNKEPNDWKNSWKVGILHMLSSFHFLQTLVDPRWKKAEENEAIGIQICRFKIDYDYKALYSLAIFLQKGLFKSLI